MQLVKLTDFFGNGAEYINRDEVAHIQPYIHETVTYEECTRTVGLVFKKQVTGSRAVYGEKRGSKVRLKCGKATCVLETPEEVAKLVEGTQGE